MRISVVSVALRWLGVAGGGWQIVYHEGTVLAGGFIFGIKHEVVDDQLLAAVEEVC